MVVQLCDPFSASWRPLDYDVVCRDVDDLLTSGTQLEKLVVLHPAIVPVEAQLVYVAYNGWIYSGRSVLH